MKTGIIKTAIVALLIAAGSFHSQAQINISGIKLKKKTKENETSTNQSQNQGSNSGSGELDNGNHKKKYSEKEAQEILDKKIDPAFGYKESLKRLNEIGNEYKYVQNLAQCAADYTNVMKEMNEFEKKYGEYCYVIDKNTATGNDDLCFRLKDDKTALANFNNRVTREYVNADTCYARGARVFAAILKSADQEKQNGRTLSAESVKERFKEVDICEGALKFFEPNGTRDKELEQKKSECNTQLKNFAAEAEKVNQAKEEKRQAEMAKKRAEELTAKASKETSPLDVYKGADKEQLKNVFKKDWTQIQKENPECAQITILKVYIVWDNWQRTQKKEWHGNSLVNIDESTLLFNVVFQPKKNPSSDLAYIESFYMTKDHINGNAISYSKIPCSAMISLGNPAPILIKNVK